LVALGLGAAVAASPAGCAPDGGGEGGAREAPSAPGRDGAGAGAAAGPGGGAGDGATGAELLATLGRQGAIDAVVAREPRAGEGRTYVVRKDGGRIPLLTRAELEAMHGPEGPGGGGEGRRGGEGAPGPAAVASPPAAYDLSAYQTPVKDQLDRGTCGTFATVAAIEAAYKRAHGLTLDLSEQYLFHVAKSTGVSYPRIYQYENQSSYWYGGGWVPDARRYALPLEAQAPYAGYARCPASNPSCVTLNAIPGAAALVWAADPAANHVTQQQVDAFEYSPLHVPPEARRGAKYGVASYSDYGAAVARDPAALEALLASSKEVVVSVDLKWRLGAGGVYDYDAGAAGGGHAFLLIGYDRAAGHFLVKNSWGGVAPSAYLKVSYEFMRRAAYGAATVDAVVAPSAPPQDKAKWLGAWYQDHDGWHGTLVVRRVTDPSNAPTRLGTYYADGSYAAGHSANGYALDGGRGARFYVAPEVENAPGTLAGQRFDAHAYGWDPAHAAGMTWFGASGEAGVHLGRAPFRPPYSNAFSPSEWVGTWDMNYDGWRGTLTIFSVTPAAGDYVVSAGYVGYGVSRPVTGTLERDRPGVAHLSIDFGTPQPFTLYHHFWEDKFASGYALAGGARYGAHAAKR
jgi:hypothetical protein